MGDDKDKQEGMGFSGISSLLPDEPLDTAAQQSASDSSGSDSQSTASPADTKTSAAPPRAAQSQTSPNTTQPQESAPPRRHGGGAIWAWIGIAVVILAIWVASQSGTESNTQSSYQPPVAQTDTSTPPSSASQTDQASTATGATSQPAEPFFQRPPVGSGNVFAVAEIRYCLALKEQVEGAKPVVDTYSQVQVDRFNAMVDEYNSRCHDFRYYDTSLQQAQRDIDPHTKQFRAQGVRWVLYGETETANTQAESNQPTNQLAAPDTGNNHTQPRAAEQARSQPSRTRRVASGHGGRASAGAGTAPLDTSLVHARQIGNCSPMYPVEAARTGRSGTTILAVHVGTDGGVTSVRVASSSGSSALDRAAVDAMEQCQFTPATRGGQAVTDELRMPVNFTFSQQLISPDATGAYH